MGRRRCWCNLWVTHLLLVNDVDACLDVREGVRRGEDGFPLVLLDQVAVCTAVQRERRAVHEGAQVVVLVKVGDPLLQLVGVEERLHVGDLEVGLEHKKLSVLHNVHTAALLHTHTRLTLPCWDPVCFCLPDWSPLLFRPRHHQTSQSKTPVPQRSRVEVVKKNKNKTCWS